VLAYWPCKNDYRKQDLNTAAKRFRTFLEEGA